MTAFLDKIRAEQKRRIEENRLFTYYPDEGPFRLELYPKHLRFFDAGAFHRQRAMLAGNRVGKTEGVGGYEVTLHLTGLYPHWWEGRRFEHPIHALVAGDTATTTRDIIQKKLCGTPGGDGLGTGLIPKRCIGETVNRAGVPEAFDLVRVEHVSGGSSTLQFRSYDQRRQAFQGTERHVIWLDEEPPEDIYGECLIRTMTTKGIVLATFTPIEGMTKVAKEFVKALSDPGSKWCIQAGWNDVPHLTEEDKAELLSEIPIHMRKARTMGEPTLGSGSVFPIDEEKISIKAFEIPWHWRHIVGIDFGWDHPFAAVELVHDPDADIIYVIKCYRQKETTPVIHAAAIKPWGAWLPIAWPHDGLQHKVSDRASAVRLKDLYGEQGLNMLPEMATHEGGGNGVEAGVIEMYDRMLTGRWKVFSHLEDWFHEFRYYHRKDGLIVKEVDDLLDASRTGLMMLRYADYLPKQKQAYESAKRSARTSSWAA
jgi:phage terminase large subunit-like protein